MCHRFFQHTMCFTCKSIRVMQKFCWGRVAPNYILPPRNFQKTFPFFGSPYSKPLKIIRNAPKTKSRSEIRKQNCLFTTFMQMQKVLNEEFSVIFRSISNWIQKEWKKDVQNLIRNFPNRLKTIFMLKLKK